jgi:hypothetical protein
VAWFDKESEYFQSAQGPLRQGDVVLAPCAVLEPGIGETPGLSPRSLGEEATVQIWKSKSQTFPEAPTVRMQVRWDLAMVLPHDCALEKDFNEKVADLMANHRYSETDAIATASADPTLDRYVAVAPIRAYEEAAPHRREGIRTGQRLGTFPVPAGPTHAIEAGWVDLSAPTTIDRTLFSVASRLSSLTDRAADYLRASLARHWAYRDLTRADEISVALGRTIVDIKAAPMPKDKLRLELFLDGNAGTITLEGSNKPAPPDRTSSRKA